MDNLNKFKGVVNDAVKKVDVKYLNPLQCNLSFMNCNMFIYFVIGMIALFTLLLIFMSSRYSKISLLLATLSLCIVFIGCSLLLLNMCILKKPEIYSYITLGCAIFVVIIIFAIFRPSQTPTVITVPASAIVQK